VPKAMTGVAIVIPMLNEAAGLPRLAARHDRAVRQHTWRRRHGAQSPSGIGETNGLTRGGPSGAGPAVVNGRSFHGSLPAFLRDCRSRRDGRPHSAAIFDAGRALWPLLAHPGRHTCGDGGEPCGCWTTVPLLLTGPVFGMSQGRLAFFALVGGAGAIAAPIAGRLADRGYTRPATAFAILAVGVAFLLTHLLGDGSAFHLACLIAAAILLDFGMTANLTLGQRAIFVLGAEFRSRLNGLYIAAFFAGGAAGSSLGGWAYSVGGWRFASAAGCAFAVLAFGLFLTEFVHPKTTSQAG
jgi:hypothetical protein